MSDKFTPQQLADHASVVVERMGDATAVELQLELTERRQLLHEVAEEDHVVLLAEIEAIDQAARAMVPAPQTPEEVFQSLPDGDPRKETLGHTLQARQLEEALASAAERFQQYPTSENAKAKLEAAEEALRLHRATPPAPIAREGEINRLRREVDNIPARQREALDIGDIDTATALTGELERTRTKLAELTAPAPSAPPAPPGQPVQPDPVAIAERAVQEAQQGAA